MFKNQLVELDDGNIQVFRFLADGSDQVMAQVHFKCGSRNRSGRIQELCGRQRYLVLLNLWPENGLVRCGNLEGNENASFWSRNLMAKRAWLLKSYKKSTALWTKNAQSVKVRSLISLRSFMARTHPRNC